MQVVLTDYRYTDPDAGVDPWREPVEAAGAELVYGEYGTIDEVREGVRDADAVITFKAPMTRDVIEAMGDCRLILRTGAGYDNVNIHAATANNVPVTTLRGYANDDLSEGAMTLLLAASRDLVWADRDVRASTGFGTRKSTSVLHGKTLGVVGMGNIGQRAVVKAQGLGMDVIASDPYASETVFEALEAERVDFDELLERADAITLHCQLNHQTHHLFGADEFARMKDSAIFVNTARGPLMDEAALVDAVESGEIFGAGIDVYETEPPEDAPALDCDHIVCSPHRIGGDTPDQDERGKAIGREHLRRALTGQELRHVVNPGAIKHRDGLLNPELENWR